MKLAILSLRTLELRFKVSKFYQEHNFGRSELSKEHNSEIRFFSGYQLQSNEDFTHGLVQVYDRNNHLS